LLLIPALGVVCLTSVCLAFVVEKAFPISVSITISSLLLATVHSLRDRIQPDARTALADLVLLTPIVALLV
jgi:hypothetical protein